MAYQIFTHQTPGAAFTVAATLPTLDAARRAASRGFGHRRDLKWQDVVIVNNTTGRREFAGPAR